jgi:hypothetical protein
MEGSYDYKQAKNDVGLFMGERQALVFLMEGFHYSFFTTHTTHGGYKELFFFPFYVTIRVKNRIFLLLRLVFPFLN